MSNKLYWCEFAIVDAQTHVGVVLEVSSERIVGIETAVAMPPSSAKVLSGVTLAAFANAHSHAFQRALRGRTHLNRGSFWTWRDLMYQTANRLDPDSYYHLAKATFAEMALAGIGVVGEFHYVHHQADGTVYEDRNAMGKAVAVAAQDTGIRLTLLDAIYLRGGFDTTNTQKLSGYRSLRPEQQRFSDGDVASWRHRVEDLDSTISHSTTKVGAAIHSVRAVDPESIAEVAKWANQHATPLHVHVSEQHDEDLQCIATHGCTPTVLLRRNGALGANCTFVHATHVAAPEIKMMASSSVMCCLCPTTERDLGDGVGPASELHEAGVALCVGSDSQADIDVLAEVKAVESDQRNSNQARGVFRSEALLAMATSNGYKSLGWAEGGTLAVGSLADFVTIGLTSVRLVGSDKASLLGHLLFAANSADVKHLVVAGKEIVDNGEHTTINTAAELASAIEHLYAP